MIEVADEVELEFARGGEQHPAAPAIVRVLGSTVAAALGLQQGDCIGGHRVWHSDVLRCRRGEGLRKMPGV